MALHLRFALRTVGDEPDDSVQHISGKGDTKFPDPDSILDELERKVKHVRWAID